MADIETNLQTIIDAAQEYAQDVFDQSVELINEALAVTAIPTPIAPAQAVDFDEQFEPPVGLLSPGPFVDSFVRPTGFPVTPNLTPLYTPVFDNIGNAPTLIDTDDLFLTPLPVPLETFTEPAPTLDQFLTPTAPILNIPITPIFRPINEPIAPTVTLPSFDIPPPGNPPELTRDAAQEFEDAYNQISPQLQAYVLQSCNDFIAKFSPNSPALHEKLVAKLNSRLDGGTGFDPVVEAQLFDRERGRTAREGEIASAAAFRTLAARGHTFPNGAILSELRLGKQRALDANAASSMDILKIQAELEQRNLEFAINTSNAMTTELRNHVINYLGVIQRINSDAIQYARNIAEWIVGAYNSRVRAFETTLVVYQVQGKIFELQIQASLAQIEIFNAEVKLAELQGTLNELDLNLYRGQIDAEEAKLSLYTEQLRALAIQRDGERIKIELFGEKVKAYSARAQAKGLEYTAFESSISADEAKVRASIAQIDGFRAEVDAKVAKGNLELAKQQGTIESSKNQLEIFRTELGAYATKVDIEKAIFDGALQSYLAGIDQYKVDVNRAISEQETRLLYVREAAINARLFEELRTKVNIEGATLLNNSIAIRATAATQGAATSTSMAAAVLSAQNTVVQLAQTF